MAMALSLENFHVNCVLHRDALHVKRKKRPKKCKEVINALSVQIYLSLS